MTTPTSQHRIRRAHVARSTAETTIDLDLDLDGTGTANISTGVLFFDHMLNALSRHSRIDINVKCRGDAAMDPHHSVEDVGIALGQAIRQALGDRAGIARFGYAYAPLDEALARCVVDCSGRPYLEFIAPMPEPLIGSDFASSLVEEFWRALVVNAYLTVHIDLIRSRNAHHAAEAIFKSSAVALRAAFQQTSETGFIPSTKGLLA
ncbi:imidazoleglycerol-phosphate dehydratase HisB [soil metagenome]